MARERVERELDLRRPVTVWSSQDYQEGGPASSLTMILRTVGCRWNRCTMCGYAGEGAPATAEDLIAQFECAMQRSSMDVSVVKIYTSGSFLDSAEMPVTARDEILKRLAALGIKKLVIETRPEYVTPQTIEICLTSLPTEFAIGLETASDLIRENAIRKGFSFQDFADAAEAVHRQGGRVKAYLLLKPPLLSEGQAMRDAIASARAARSHADILSLNLCNVQRNTVVERMWERGEFRPPWLWSALEVLKSVPGPIVCDPVGAGTRRGPHNCGECDDAVAAAIRTHALSQDVAPFQSLDCQCKSTWRELMEVEEQSFGTPLF
ncbi:MAG: archaeosine biosynthesis radical SAM protein RaSEA [Methanothrix sp.]|nr:archaeosine biosynthesis radical SAM protein RaSEA [Methanothrix sp.]